MQLLADLESYPASDAMQWAAAAQFNGTLAFQRNQRLLTMTLDQGRIVRCESNRPHEGYRQHLYSQGWVDRLDLVAADKLAEPTTLSDKLVELGIMSERQARETYTAHTLDLACSVASWPDGVVFATAAKLRSLDAPRAQPIETVFATMEAARRVDELQNIRQIVPHDNVTLGAGPNAQAPPRLDPGQQRLLEFFDGSQTVGELYQVVGGCRYNFMRNLEALLEAGVLACVEVGTPPEPAAPNRRTLLDVLLDNQSERRQLA